LLLPYVGIYMGTDIADGTRYEKRKLSEMIKSLPYTIKFRKEYYRVMHEEQGEEIKHNVYLHVH